jgi:hypothetical protein
VYIEFHISRHVQISLAFHGGLGVHGLFVYFILHGFPEILGGGLWVPSATCKVYFRKLQCLDYCWKLYQASEKYVSEVGNLLWSKFCTMPVFVQWATSPEFWKKEIGGNAVRGQEGICHWTMPKFLEFCQSLTSQTAAAFAELIYGLMTTLFDMQCLKHVTDHPEGGDNDYISLGNFLRGDGEAGPLHIAFKKFTQSLSAQAATIDGSGETDTRQPLAAMQMVSADGDEEEQDILQEKKEIFEKILAGLEGAVRFHALPGNVAGPFSNFMAAAELTKVLANCPFHSSAIGGTQGKKQNAWLLSADLFPDCMGSGAKDLEVDSVHQEAR